MGFAYKIARVWAYVCLIKHHSCLWTCWTGNGNIFVALIIIIFSIQKSKAQKEEEEERLLWIWSFCTGTMRNCSLVELIFQIDNVSYKSTKLNLQ